ncbi:Acetyltransferase [Streptococcus suis 05ZYH33]|nr:Acetyltransferase [Streptococcus suis 05ZYH33]
MGFLPSLFWYNILMLENNRLNELILRFPEDVQLIFKDMIPSYQLGYVDYVYQTR